MEQGFFIPIGTTISKNREERAILELTDQNPHGILSGMTGSGKSELILTIITSIVIKYSPEEVNFAIIDFKAGSTSDLVVGLPHCAGVASDLEDSDAIVRAINLLKAESSRRQKILTDAVKAGIISKAEASEYRMAREKNKSLEPLPLLLIIVDEYGELKKQFDKFDAELATIAKQGRSRFMYLLLADNESKSFHGVSSNISYRICMGFSDISEIHAVLNLPIKKEDKVFIEYSCKNAEGKIPRGRGIINSNGNIVAFQSPYVRASTQGYKSQLDAFIINAKLKYEARGIIAYCVLPSQLPEKYLGDAGKFLNGFDYKTGKYSLSINWNIPIGVFDDTLHNNRPYYYVNPPLENLVIVGNKGSGKTSAMKTILFNVMNRISPKMCNVIIMNFGDSYSFDEFKDMPHVSDVLDLGMGVKKEAREKLERSLSVLRNIIDKQSGKFIGERTEYLIFIDGYKFFSDHYPQIEMHLRDIITGGKTAGISFVITCNKIRYISENVRGVLQQRILLRNADDELGFVFSGKCEKKASTLCLGRGIIEDDDCHYFDMQISYPACIDPKSYEIAIKDFKRIYYSENTFRANAIPYMPSVLSLKQVISSSRDNLCNIYFGMETTKLGSVCKSLYDIDFLFIEGTVQSGKSFLIDMIIEQLKKYKSECTMVILDNNKQQHYSPDKPNIECISAENSFGFISSISEYNFEEGKETFFIIDDYHLLFANIKAKDKSVYDTFYRWIQNQRSSNAQAHFVIANAAEANGFEMFPNFQFNERILIGNRQMMSRFAAPASLKSATTNVAIDKNYAWICFADTNMYAKLINTSTENIH